MVIRYACHLALLSFAACLVHGLFNGSDLEGSLQTGMIASVGFYALGLLCAELGRRVAEEAAEAIVEHHRSEAFAGFEVEMPSDSPPPPTVPEPPIAPS